MGGKHEVAAAPAKSPAGFARRWVAGLGVKQIRQLVVLAVLAVTALFGGLDTVNTNVTDFEPGESFSDGLFTLTIDRASLVTELTAGSKIVARAKPGLRYLGIVATVRNDGTVPGAIYKELVLRDQPDSRFRSAVRMADGSYVGTLGPGLSEQLAFLWEVPENAIVPGDSVTVRVWKKQYRELALTYSASGKAVLDSTTEYGQIVIPVRVAT
jgi:hypothetical protein